MSHLTKKFTQMIKKKEIRTNRLEIVNINGNAKYLKELK